jgi:hypothetical protein
MIFDKSVQIKQLTVVEAHGILLFRTDKGNRFSSLHDERQAIVDLMQR